MNILIAACRAAFDETAAVGQSHEPVDWDLFLRLAAFHRVEGLAWRGIERTEIRFPAECRALLKGQAKVIASNNLAMAVEAGRINGRFVDAGVPLVFLKGLPLAVMAYGDIASKSAVDLDLLVPPSQLTMAAGILGEAGYRPIVPDLSHGMVLADWHKHHKESNWRCPETGTLVDLHTALVDVPNFLPKDVLRQSVRAVEVGSGIAIPSLSGDVLAVYLAMHGASSAWFRLKWAVDFAALLAKNHRGRIGGLRAAAERWGAARVVDQALLVSDRLFRTLDAEAALRPKVARDWRARGAASMALRYLTRSSREPIEPTARRLGTLGIHAAQLLALPDAVATIGAVARKSRALIGDWRS